MNVPNLFAGIVFLLFTGTRPLADDQKPDLTLLRKNLITAIGSSTVTDSLYSSLEKTSGKTPLITAYLAALDALKAKHSWNPYSKLKYLNIAEKVMQQAVNGDPHNIEIRFMRFSIQYNVPGFLGYGKDIPDDKAEMLKQLGMHNYGTADKELTISIIRFLLGSKKCSAAEDAWLNRYLAALK